MEFTHPRHFRPAFMLLVFLVVLAIAGCQAAAPSNTEQEPPPPTEDTAAPPQVVTESPTSAPTSTMPTAEETSTAPPMPEVSEVDSCITCHTDQQALVNTAKAVEVVVSESSGEG